MHEIDAEPDFSLMENAKARGMDGIEAECGGSMNCGLARSKSLSRGSAPLPPASAMDAEMVEYTRYLRPTSRLSCQIVVAEAMDGLEVGIPKAQR